MSRRDFFITLFIFHTEFENPPLNIDMRMNLTRLVPLMFLSGPTPHYLYHSFKNQPPRQDKVYDHKIPRGVFHTVQIKNTVYRDNTARVKNGTVLSSSLFGKRFRGGPLVFRPGTHDGDTSRSMRATVGSHAAPLVLRQRTRLFGRR